MAKHNDRQFKPDVEMEIVKARLTNALEDRMVLTDVESLTIEQLENIAGCLKIGTWAKEWDEFLPWLLDKDYVKHKIMASRALAVEKLVEVLNSDLEAKILTAKDWVNAAKELLTLADAYPTKRKEVTYLDRAVANMTEEQLELEMVKTRERLSPPVPPSKQIVDIENE